MEHILRQAVQSVQKPKGRISQENHRQRQHRAVEYPAGGADEAPAHRMKTTDKSRQVTAIPANMAGLV